MKDSFGEIEVFLMPFLKPALVSPYFQEEVSSYEKAVELVLQSVPKDLTRRNILLAHQFVTWRGEAERSDSETYSLGGVDAVDAGVFSEFDYVALGHLHSPQKIGREEIRYAGSPLAYSFSEIRRKKSITMVEFNEKGNIKMDFLPLTPKRPLREIKGPLQSLLEAAKAQGGSEDYIRAILTDKSALNDPLGQLRFVYPNLMTMELEGQERQEREILFSAEDTSPKELFRLFFQRQNDKEMDPQQEKAVEKIWGAMGGEGE